ncbi:MAG: ABC transporter ATP-binding protein [Phycisphaerales bacterium]|nr:ABC transporter ATP-binding protein [Phycisphaerales bacterium]
MMRLTFKTQRGRFELSRVVSIFRQYAVYLRPHRGKLIIALLASIATIGFQVLAPWPIKLIFDYVLSDKLGDHPLGAFMASIATGPQQALLWICGTILVVAFLEAISTHVRELMLAQAGQRIIGKIRQDLYAHLQTLSPTIFERRRTGDLLTRLTGDIQMLRQMLLGAVVMSTQNALIVVVMLVASFWINPKLATLAFCVMPVILYSTWRTTRQIRKATTKQRDNESFVTALAHDVLNAMPTIQAFNRQSIEHQRFCRVNRRTVRAGVKTTRLESRLYRTIAVASAAGTCLILYVGVGDVLRGTMTAGDLLVFLAYLRSIQKPTRQLAKISGQVAKATACGRRVAELFALRPEVVDRPGATTLASSEGRIGIHEVSFAYPDGTPALREVSLDIASGQRVAVVGYTGAGKSTLARLLLRFHDPNQGSITIDGQDIRGVTLESLRRQIAWVHQDTVLFGMTVRENIALGAPDATDEEIESVARRVCADEFIKSLPDGYDTLLGQDGITLSGGQRQRLALARALLLRAPILILDEPATGLDAQTRIRVEASWMASDDARTTLVICHRLVQMERFDRIVVMRSGRIAESGTHEELLRCNGEYAALFKCGRDDIRLREEERIAC